MKKILIILIGCLLSFKTFSFEKFNLNDVDPSENIIVEDLYEPLEVTGDAIPWQLFGKTVTIMGFMFPLEQSEKQKKFLIGPYPLSCPFHYHVGPSQVIEISSDEAVDFSFDPITIKGELKVKYNEETGTFYYLKIMKL